MASEKIDGVSGKLLSHPHCCVEKTIRGRVRALITISLTDRFDSRLYIDQKYNYGVFIYPRIQAR